jgi:uncharacterized pyridoxal phosphate-containing UPF0001 family protein
VSAADDVRQNVDQVRRRIAQACQRAGRPAAAVTLIGVTKGVPADIIREVLALGLSDIGENRVQEARNKRQALGEAIGHTGVGASGAVSGAGQSGAAVRWHMVGHLQRNKAKDAVELFDAVHSVDSSVLAEELNRQAAKRPRDPASSVLPPAQAVAADAAAARPAAGAAPPPLEVFVQVNVSGESSKFGCRPEETPALARAIWRLERVRLAGLMTIAPWVEDPEQARPIFRRLRGLRDELATALSWEPRELALSMGMSQDFEVAVEEGADLVRIGTALFGPRPAG